MPNDLSNRWGKDLWRHFILKKSNQFDLKLGELINLLLWFCVDDKDFPPWVAVIKVSKKVVFLQLP